MIKDDFYNQITEILNTVPNREDAVQIIHKNTEEQNNDIILHYTNFISEAINKAISNRKYYTEITLDEDFFLLSEDDKNFLFKQFINLGYKVNIPDPKTILVMI